MDTRIDIPNPFGAGVWYKERTGSTMDDARALIMRGEPSGSIAWAGLQDQGRGRFSDRAWVTRAGEALLFTIAIVDNAAPGAFPLSLQVALGLARFIESKGLTVQIKWPNDVLIAGKKTSGILVIGAGEWKYIGIGVNLKQKAFDQQELRRPATSLSLEGVDIDVHDALRDFLPFLFDALHGDVWTARAEVEKRLWNRGVETEIIEQPGKTPKRGILRGIDFDGALLLETPLGDIRCLSGE